MRTVKASDGRGNINAHTCGRIPLPVPYHVEGWPSVCIPGDENVSSLKPRSLSGDSRDRPQSLVQRTLLQSVAKTPYRSTGHATVALLRRTTSTRLGRPTSISTAECGPSTLCSCLSPALPPLLGLPCPLYL